LFLIEIDMLKASTGFADKGNAYFTFAIVYIHPMLLFFSTYRNS
jgi:hypothetical protein